MVRHSVALPALRPAGPRPKRNGAAETSTAVDVIL
jgi:hypothetical protein